MGYLEQAGSHRYKYEYHPEEEQPFPYALTEQAVDRFGRRRNQLI